MIALNLVVRNEAERIIDCLTRAARYCDELVVVDQESDDGTVDLARDFGSVVLTDICYGFCEPSRPLAAQHTESDWIMVLDADEHLDEARIPELPNIMTAFLGAKLPVMSSVGGVCTDPWLGDHYHPNRQFRFFKRGMALYGMTLHSRISPAYGGEMTFVPTAGPWLYNVKSRDEWDADASRYASLGR